MIIGDPQRALERLEQLGAPRRLLIHHTLVVEAATALLDGLARFAAHFNRSLVLLGTALHDVGKIALADKLWKGKRVEALERVVVERLAQQTGEEFWAVFVDADAVFEAVAAGADERLARSAG